MYVHESCNKCLRTAAGIFTAIKVLCAFVCLVLYLYFVFVLFSFVVVMFPFGRLLVLYFSLVVPAICNFLLHICTCFPSKINDDDDDE